MSGVSVKGLIARLKLPAPTARRLAIRDLLSRDDDEGTIAAALTDHLESEDDIRAQVMIARALGERRAVQAASVLAALRDDPDTPVEVAHAATIAFDQIERSQSDANRNSAQ